MKSLVLLGYVWSLSNYQTKGVIGHCEHVVLALLATYSQVLVS